MAILGSLLDCRPDLLKSEKKNNTFIEALIIAQTAIMWKPGIIVMILT